jgi:hypothetical protein
MALGYLFCYTPGMGVIKTKNEHTKLWMAVALFSVTLGVVFFVGRSISPSMTEKEALGILHTLFLDRQSQPYKACPYSADCFKALLPRTDRYKIAKALAVSDKADDTIFVGLQQGGSVDKTSIGSNYLDRNAWYWEIGACSTNNRLFIHAATGQKLGPTTYIYCGGTP